MLLRAARPVFVALGAIRNCSSRGRPLKRNCSFIGLLCHREFSATRGVCQSNMEIPSNGPTLVAVCQMNSTNDVDRNLGICEDLVRKAKSRGAKVRFLCSHMRKAILYSILGPVLQPLLNPRTPPPPPPPPAPFPWKKAMEQSHLFARKSWGHMHERGIHDSWFFFWWFCTSDTHLTLPSLHYPSH